ncbi:probable ubiquitin carboxyl-terminal hydrolase FAF-X isoform X4 [Pipistrellus kuhlii]|uniref:probable ubiquitin carboxyl-terminal hydrolase FAF-X isoform X4 n=1 Tax=Pipistrellus kuhlii TaxID=59472 RepID=UPI00174EFAAF|nr:probable ubiquitin carboxyl-terminal hydrolase FAF-X isoform X4 [Pipistrellus kuhlii]
MTATKHCGSPIGGDDSQGHTPDGQSPSSFQQNQTLPPDSSNENSPAMPPDEQGQGDAPPQQEDEEPDFPHNDLAKLDDMINRPRWVVPVLPKGELEVLLEAAIDLSKKGLDVKSEACQRFFRDGLTISFTKILMDEAVSGWKFEIHRCIINNTHRLVELCVATLSQDWFPLLELLAMALNPYCKFHMYNSSRQCESIFTSAQLSEDELFACSSDPRLPKGWLVDLINKFGSLNGFQILHDRFINGSALNVQIITALIKPFGQCYEFLSQYTVKKYFIPVIEVVTQFLENLNDEELKKEAKSETKNDALSMIIKSLKNLASRIPEQDETVKNLEILRLKTILRLLQISSFNGKMNALNEINKVISSVSYYTHRHGNPEEEEWLTAERMAEWIQQHNILSIVLRDNLHQPQYVEKLEKILRFVIKEDALTLQDLDNIWAAQAGKHEAIVKNVHDLLAKLAWDFSPEQLDHLFDCFKASWTNASKKQREKLLELIRRLAEDDKDGVMAHKVLNLLWNLAHSDDVPVDIMDLALSAHIKILDYSCSQDRDTQKIQWIDRFIEELRTNDKWVIPALKQIREICSLFGEAPQNLSSSRFSQTQRSPHVFYRHDLINQLQHNHSLVTLVTENIAIYMNSMQLYAREHEDYDPQTVRLGSRYSHVQEVQERLNFLRFLLKDGQLWLCAPQAKQIWKCLAENAVYLCDREACFKWYSKLMGDEPDLDPDINKDFFENNVLQLDPSLLTENGIKCFEQFFKAVNCREGKLVVKRRAYMMDDLELIGLDYLWRVVIQSNDDIANTAIAFLKEIYTNLGPRLKVNKVVIHEDFIQSCFDRLKASHDTLCVLDGDKDNVNCAKQEAIRMVRVLTVLKEYINECDSDYHEERTILPMSRAFRGKHLSLIVRFPNHGRQVDDLDIWSHTNDTVGSVRRCILNRIKANVAYTKIELFVGGELIDSEDDGKLIGQLNLKDKSVITVKLSQVSSNMPSSPDSSSDSSTGSPGNRYNQYSDSSSPEMESCLPGVIMSQHPKYISFLWQVADLGSNLKMPQLRNGARLLMQLMPPDTTAIEKLRGICLDCAKLEENDLGPSLDSLFFGPSASQVLYLTEVVYALLMPAGATLADASSDFQFHFLKSGGLPLVLSMLTRTNFLPNADMETRRGVFLNGLKIAKLLLTAIGYGHVRAVAEACQPVVDGSDPITPASRHIPDICVIIAIQKIIWASGCGALELVYSPNEEISKIYEMTTNASNEPDMEDEQVCCEALEVMTLCFALIPTALDNLSKEKYWQIFIIDLILHCPSKTIRQLAREQFFLMCTRCCMGHRPLLFFITLLFTVLESTARERSKHSDDYFTLLQHLLNYAYNSNITVPNAEFLLNNEIDWLKNIRDNVKNTGETGIEETVLEGHLGITKELLAFQTSEKKYQIGCEKGGANLIKELIDDFIFPASKVYLQCMRNGELPVEQAIPVCSSPATITAGFELIVALAIDCVRNLKQIVDYLTEMYYIGTAVTSCEALTEWEYLPPVGPRPPKGFVGLKNAGATCYMNSVIQQLYMIPSIRNSILAIEGTGSDIDDDMFNDEKQDNESNVDPRDDVFGYPHQFEYKPAVSKTKDRKEYNIGVLRHLQVIFGHLAASQLQYYVPRGFWKQFRLWGEPINLREQHDALEFFNSLVDSLDEALKALGYPAILSQVLGGSFADQKICQGCPHRYECEESFTTLNVDIRNHQNLLDSLEQYIKGDLLEGANAYRCEKCDKKVDTVKRLLIKKLPSVLAIQLKRFDYDWERECAVKFNDYFEFPRELDMEPYTVPGVSKLEEDFVNTDSQLIPQTVQSESETLESTKYSLVGVLVHSGQASGGHYYSYIIKRNGKDGKRNRWYKFDDGDVTECKMDDDEEMKNQCFGGEYMGEVFDHMMKRMSYRRQKRWWNAYILFYERMDTKDQDGEMIRYISELTITKPHQMMSSAIERSVWKQNVQFIHNQMQYSLEYFQFMKKLLTCNGIYLSPTPGQDQLLPEAEEITMITIQLAARFLFTTGFHTKKIVRGPASDWYDVLCILLRHSKNVRFWFAHNVLFNVSNRFSEYLLECPSAEVRGAFAKLIVFIAHFSLQDGPYPSSFSSPGPASQACDNLNLSDHLLRAVLNLLRREVSEYGRHLQQYFNLFVMYANLGIAEKTQLLKLSVPATFMLVSLDEGPGPPIKYQYAELGKLYSVVSQLIRCCNVSSRMQSSINGNPPLPNPFGDPNLSQPIMPIQQNVADILFVRTSYVKKIIEDCSNSEETIKLLRFCCWENPQFSSTVLSELLWQVAYSYTYELRPYLDLLLQILLIEDSWQTHRIHNALKGIPDDRDGLFDTIQRSKNHYQKRAYQCIKCMVALFNNCSVGNQILQSNGDLKRKWTWAVEWLGDELERRPYTGNPQYTYNNWSPPVQSNETSNGYFLERSHSARMTFAKACELCPEEEPDDQDATDEHESSLPEDVPLYSNLSGSHYQQNNHVHGQPYTGPAGHHLNNHQKSNQQAQESDEGNEDVSSSQMRDQ